MSSRRIPNEWPVAAAIYFFEDAGGITLLADMAGVSLENLDIRLMWLAVAVAAFGGRSSPGSSDNAGKEIAGDDAVVPSIQRAYGHIYKNT